MMIRPSDTLLLVVIIAVGAIFLVAVFFAALVYVLHLRNERTEARYTALETGWDPVLHDALQSDAAAFPVNDLVADADRMHFIQYLVRYARRLRGPERRVLEDLARPLMPMVAELVAHGSAEMRASAVQTLTTLGMRDHAALVVTALDDESPLVAMTAARGLARQEHARHAAAVLIRIERFSEWNPRFLAAMLSAMGESAAPTLRGLLSDANAAPEARTIAADALAQLRDLEAGEIAARIVTGETDRQVVGAALGLLAVVGHTEHITGVTALLDSPEPWVRAHALETLARLGSATNVPVLINALDDPSPWVGLRAAYGLQEVGAFAELRSVAAGTGRSAQLAREVLSRETE